MCLFATRAFFRFLFFDSNREGLWGHFNGCFDTKTNKITSKKFYVTYTQSSCKRWRDMKCPSGTSLGRGVS